MCHSNLLIFSILTIFIQNGFAINLECGTMPSIIKLTGQFDRNDHSFNSQSSFSFFDGDFCSFGQTHPASQQYYCVECYQQCETTPTFSNLLIISTEDKSGSGNYVWFKLSSGVLTSKLTEERATCKIESPTAMASEITMTIATSPTTTTTTAGESDTLRSFSKTSVLFVSISFIILMVISLAWLVFYYVQRFRYAHAKDRLQRRLFNAARKALARIATRAIQRGDEELQTDCAVCLDPYQINDIVRQLPCKHVYHKSCIDPWLLEHRTCPMCKSDILKAFGYTYGDPNERRNLEELNPRVEVGGETGQIVNQIVSPEGTSESSGSAGFSFDHSEHVETFQFTPTVAPQLVLNASNAKSFVMPMSGRIGSASGSGSGSGSGGGREQVQPTSYSARGHSRHETTPHRVLRTASGATTSTTTQQQPQQTGPQIVNLVQVNPRATSVTRAATIRKETMAQPTPIDVVVERPTTSTNTHVV